MGPRKDLLHSRISLWNWFLYLYEVGVDRDTVTSCLHTSLEVNMVRLTVVIPFLFLVACVCAFPGTTKVSLIRNSNFGFGSAAFGGESDGVVKTKDKLAVEFPGKDADISLLDNVDSGAAFAFAGAAATGVDHNKFIPPIFG
uniref:SFRICE_016371 n=1 Tax=Spodoptera frugiperda TaxID=7108 RepID=A0A2H1V497_SPOFR